MKIGSFIFLIFSFSITIHAQTIKTEKLKFQNFDVNIINFVSQNRPFSPINTGKVDTLMISENPCEGEGWYIQDKTLNIIPKFKGDSFALSFAYKVDLLEVSESWDKNWTHFTNYKTIPPLSKNQFKITHSINKRDIQSIKKKYSFRDTSITTESESGPIHYQFTRNGKLYRDLWYNLYLRIRRYNNGKLIESKYILVGLSEGCD